MKIGEWVLREACKFNRMLLERGFPALRVAINLSARQLTHYDIVRAVAQVLRDTELPPECLELELTESMVMNEPEKVIGTLGQLRALGIQLSIDDFGTGYSSLSYLKRFPVMSLKIDKSFVSELDDDDDHDASAIVRAIISIAHSLEIKVIAEGVETEHQMSFLLANGCDSMQGFLFSKPLTGSEFIALLERESAGSGPSSLLRQLQLSFFDKPTAAVEITDS